MYTVITLFIYKLIPVTLTLAGIAGFILSIGMAVDANILIFERMKEELRRGKPRDIAMKNGFSRAWTSIRDSNVTSIIVCVILFYFGSGIVRGFALTLFIGIMVSMFSAITITRNLLIVFDSKERSNK
jgi:preprotein translocase subunit SecD